MGLFDDIYCKMPLPDDAPQFVKDCPVFQTYDLGRCMGQYIITEDGRLRYADDLTCQLPEHLREAMQPKYKRKRIRMHATNLRAGGPRKGEYVWFTTNGEDLIDIDYIVQIRDNKVSSIKETNRRVRPARPVSEMHAAH